MENSNNPIRDAARMLGGNLAKFRITKITKIAKDGHREVKKVNFEVNDVEAFRMKMKGRKFADVLLVYESIL